MSDDPRFSEHNVDYRALEIDGLVRQVETERERRIAKQYPVSRQLQLIAAGVVILFDKGLTTDERQMIETDATALRGLVKCVTRHRLAATLLIATVRKPGAALNKINPSSESWWEYDDKA